MIETTAHMKTDLGAKYLVQMCKHFAHKVEVEYSATYGECRFDGGVAILDATADGLHLIVKAENEETLAWARSALESHLVRFAFRENVQGLEWQR